MNGDSGTCDGSLARTVNRVARDSKHESLPCRKRIKQATAGARLTTADTFVIETRRIREEWAATNRMRGAPRAFLSGRHNCSPAPTRSLSKLGMPSREYLAAPAHVRSWQILLKKVIVASG